MRSLLTKKLAYAMVVFSCIALIMTACEMTSAAADADEDAAATAKSIAEKCLTKSDDSVTVEGIKTAATDKYTDATDNNKVVACADITALDLTGLDSTFTAIGDSAFKGTDADSPGKIASVTIPKSVKTIGANAFQFNVIASLTLNEGLETIGESALANNKLKEVTIPKSVKTIATKAFEGNELTKITITSGGETTLTVAATDSFRDDFKTPFEANKKAGMWTYVPATTGANPTSATWTAPTAP